MTLYAAKRNVLEATKAELRHWTQVSGTGMCIRYHGGSWPNTIDDIPHRYCCEMGDIHGPEYYCGYGVTEEDAAQACYDAWQRQDNKAARQGA